MKRITMLFLGTVIGLCFTVANGQNTRVGVKAGVNIANLSEFNGRSRISGHGGLLLHHALNKNWCIQPELLFSGEGQRFYSNAVEHTYALDYLHLPIMIQYYPVPNMYVEAGPQVSILISAQDKVDERNGHTNVKDDFAAAQLALGVGAGLELTEQVILYGRYNFGLTDLFIVQNFDAHSRVGQIGIAIRLNR